MDPVKPIKNIKAQLHKLKNGKQVIINRFNPRDIYDILDDERKEK